jgi:hypothetical protein
MKCTSLGWSLGLWGVSNEIRLSPCHWLGNNWGLIDERGLPPSRHLCVEGWLSPSKHVSTRWGLPLSRDLSNSSVYVCGRVLHPLMRRCPNRVMWSRRNGSLKRDMRCNDQGSFHITSKHDFCFTVNLP